jgi:hypothetical protein
VIGSERESLRGQSKAMQNLTEAPTEVKPARIGYFTIRGSRERNPLGYRCAGVNLTVAVAVSVGSLARHRTMLPTESEGFQQFTSGQFPAESGESYGGNILWSLPLLAGPA